MDILHDNRPAVTGPATAAVSGSIDVPTGALAMIDASTETWIRRPSKPGSAAERLLRPEDFVEFSLRTCSVFNGESIRQQANYTTETD